MTKPMRSAFLGAALIVGSMALHAAQAPQPRTTPALSESFLAAESAISARRYPEAIAKAREILASPAKSPDDVYAANSYLMRAAEAQRDTAGMAAAMEAMLGSGFSPGPAVQNQLRKGLASAYFQLKNYQQAIKHGTDLIRSGAADGDVYKVVGQSYYQARNYSEAIKLFGGLVADAEKAGRKPDRNQLNLLYSAYDKTGNAEAAQTTLEKMVRHYPAADTWLVLLYDVKNEKLDPRQKVQLFRLMDVTGNLKHSVDLMDYSTAAQALGLFEEAIKPLETGLQGKAFKTAEELGRVERYRKSNRTRADAALAELPKLEAAARSTATGTELIAVAMQQYSYGQYAKAVESAKAGIAKGGLKNLADAQLTLGVAQLKAQQKAEAAKTLRAIKTDNAATQRLAKLWALYAGS